MYILSFSMIIPVKCFCVTPAGTSNEFDVQNEWEENTHNTHAADMERKTRYIFSRLTLVVLSIFKRPTFERLSP